MPEKAKVVMTHTRLPSANPPPAAAQMARSSEAEKQSQIKRLRDFHARNKDASDAALARIKQAALSGDNLFAELVEAVKVCSLGQLSDILYQVGGGIGGMFDAQNGV